MKMSSVFRLPVTTMSLAYNTASDESNTVILDAVAHAINQHDKLVDALGNMTPLAAAHACYDDDWKLIDAALAVLNSEGIE